MINPQMSSWGGKESERPTRAFLQVPDNFYELSDDAQKVICLEMAVELQRRLGIVGTGA